MLSGGGAIFAGGGVLAGGGGGGGGGGGFTGMPHEYPKHFGPCQRAAPHLPSSLRRRAAPSLQAFHPHGSSADNAHGRARRGGAGSPWARGTSRVHCFSQSLAVTCDPRMGWASELYPMHILLIPPLSTCAYRPQRPPPPQGGVSHFRRDAEATASAGTVVPYLEHASCGRTARAIEEVDQRAMCARSRSLRTWDGRAAVYDRLESNPTARVSAALDEPPHGLNEWIGGSSAWDPTRPLRVWSRPHTPRLFACLSSPVRMPAFAPILPCSGALLPR